MTLNSAFSVAVWINKFHFPPSNATIMGLHICPDTLCESVVSWNGIKTNLLVLTKKLKVQYFPKIKFVLCVPQFYMFFLKAFTIYRWLFSVVNAHFCGHSSLLNVEMLIKLWVCIMFMYFWCVIVLRCVVLARLLFLTPPKVSS